MSNRCQRRRGALRATGAFTVLAGTPFVFTGSAQAAQSTFEATAAAYGFDYLMSNASIAAGVSPEFAGPVAQANLTSLPSGTSFASLPYPGDVAAGVPGLIPSVVQGLPQTPSYPFIVTSGLGQGKQEINQGPISMRAQTEENNANAHAVLGTEGSGSVSDAVIRTDSSTVAAESIARQGAISLGDQGEIGSIVSSASAVRGYDGKLEKTSHLSISGIRFPGLQFTMPPTTPAPAPVPNTPQFPSAPAPFAGMTFLAPTFGFYDGQFTVQLPGVGPQQYKVDNAAVASAFKSAGFDVTYTAPVETKTGITGATFTFHWLAPAPPDNPLYTGVTDFSLVFGRATANIGGAEGGFDTTGAGISSAGTGVNGAGLDGAGATAAGLGADGPGAVDAAGLTPGVLPGTDAASAGVVDSNGLPVANLIPADRVQAAGDSNSLHIDQLSNLYLVLVAAGVIGVFSIPTLRLLGARAR